MSEADLLHLEEEVRPPRGVRQLASCGRKRPRGDPVGPDKPRSDDRLGERRRLTWIGRPLVVTANDRQTRGCLEQQSLEHDEDY